MGKLARKYTRTTIRRLDTLAGNQCSKPDCSKPLITKDKSSIISKICHIEAASAGGTRYNQSMTDEERRHFNNLILLCDECHTTIDNKQNEHLYTVVLLKEWKKNHESIALNKLSSSTSFLKLAVNAISNVEFEDQDGIVSNNKSFDIEAKISHNDIKRNRSLIDSYRVYYAKINSIYDELEKQGSFKKEKLLRNIKNIYLKARGGYVVNSADPISIIRLNADNIIENIEDELFNLINKNRDQNKEDIAFEISIIMVDAFMRCKILEEPNT